MQGSVCDAVERQVMFNSKGPERERYFNEKERGNTKGYIGQDL